MSELCVPQKKAVAPAIRRQCLAALKLPQFAMAIVLLAASPQLIAMPLGPVPTADDVDELNGAPMLMPPAASADRLRNDPVQQAPLVMPPSAGRQSAVKLTQEQRVLSQYIARTWRVAEGSVDEFVYYAFKTAREFRLEPHLVLAVMAVESSFNPQAESGAGAQGLMQIHTKVHTRLFEQYGGVSAAWDPSANIKVGARILSDYLRRYGDVAGALKAYVGAALHNDDGGYGGKVMSQQVAFDALARSAAARTRSAAKAAVKTQATTRDAPVGDPKG